MKIHLELIKGNDKLRGEKIRFRRFRIRENMWWTRYRATVVLSILMVCLKGFEGPWYIYLFRFVLLFSYLIPISLRVNLDLGKIMYSWQIQNDKDIPGTVTRSTTIPEELGRIAYLLSDKTGTLTKNIMVFKKFHLGEYTKGPLWCHRESPYTFSSHFTWKDPSKGTRATITCSWILTIYKAKGHST